MARRKARGGMGQAISTFTFLIFGGFLGLAALAEGGSLRGLLIGLCAVLSLMAALRFRIQALVEHWQGGRH